MTIQLTRGETITWDGGKPIIVHINQHNIRKSINGDTTAPVVTIKYKSKTYVCNGVKWDAKGELRYSGAGNKPLLSCGARVVLDVYGNVEITE